VLKKHVKDFVDLEPEDLENFKNNKKVVKDKSLREKAIA